MKPVHLAQLLPVLALSMAGCSALQPANVPVAAVYRLDTVATVATVPNITAPARATGTPAASILIGNIRAAAGFDSNHMLFMRQPHQIEEFQQSQWQKPPAAMLMPLVTSALESSGLFKVVLQAPTALQTTYRLDLEIRSLQQDFTSTPSRVHFVLRAHLSDTKNQQITAWREFEVNLATPTEDAYGGVLASNQAVTQALKQLTGFCAEQVGPVK
ncbi:ABC-type transport auxiliary lipoprotein family protein [Undibacterium sp. Ji50W]|uniref:ABC-type transport auxiliary lipoprotein family protein n=1 Tax=Undibacterium sp. Ji50W TaxID=3413041 RepID=UPI003BF26F4B